MDTLLAPDVATLPPRAGGAGDAVDDLDLQRLLLGHRIDVDPAPSDL